MSSQFTTTTVESAVKAIKTSKYLIPTFQRDYVWSKHHVVTLLDSIAKGYPIGVITTWETTEIEFGFKTFGDVHNKPQKYSTEYVIDGQQRLTSLYYAFTGESRGKNIYIDTTILSQLFNPDIKLQAELFKKPILGSAMPKNYILFTDMLTEQYDTSAITGEALVNLTKLKQLFLNYQLNIQKISAPLEDITDIFERINTSGKTLTILDLMVAKTGAYINLRDEFESLKNKLPKAFKKAVNFNQCEPIKLLIPSDTLTYKNKLLQINPKLIAKEWDDISESTLKAIKLIQSLGIKKHNNSKEYINNKKYLNNKLLITTVAYFYYKATDEITNDQLKNVLTFITESEKTKLLHSYREYTSKFFCAMDDILSDTFKNMNAYLG